LKITNRGNTVDINIHWKEYGFKAESIYEEYKDYMEYYGYEIFNRVERPVALGAGPALG